MNESVGVFTTSRQLANATALTEWGQIDPEKTHPTPNVSIRAATSLKDCAENLTDSLNHLSGRFYSIEGEYLRQNEYEYKTDARPRHHVPERLRDRADRNHSPSVTSKELK